MTIAALPGRLSKAAALLVLCSCSLMATRPTPSVDLVTGEESCGSAVAPWADLAATGYFAYATLLTLGLASALDGNAAVALIPGAAATAFGVFTHVG